MLGLHQLPSIGMKVSVLSPSSTVTVGHQKQTTDATSKPSGLQIPNQEKRRCSFRFSVRKGHATSTSGETLREKSEFLGRRSFIRASITRSGASGRSLQPTTLMRRQLLAGHMVQPAFQVHYGLGKAAPLLHPTMQTQYSQYIHKIIRTVNLQHWFSRARISHVTRHSEARTRTGKGHREQPSIPQALPRCDHNGSRMIGRRLLS